MALIKLGSMITRVSGKIGGQTFGTSASGSYVKNSGTPRKSITLAQRDKMALMGTTAQSWRELTQAQRDVFNAASPDYPYLNRVGETKYYTGFAIYGQLRNNVSASSVSGPSVPIPLPKFSFVPLSDVLWDDWPFTDILTLDTPQEGVSYRLFMTRVSSKGISNGYKNHFFINSGISVAGADIVLPSVAQYTARFGAPGTTGKFFWRIDGVHNASGQIYKGLNSGVRIYI